MRNLYKARGRQQSSELKSVELRPHERETFVRDLLALRKKYPDILFAAITVNKASVPTAFRLHLNGLYNDMTRLMLLQKMGNCDYVDLTPDARSVKVDLKHAFHDYLRTSLAEKGFETQLTTTPGESRDNLAVQFADILASIVWSHFEYDSPLFLSIQESVSNTKLFFKQDDPTV